MYSIYTFLLLNKANKAYCYRASCAKLDNFDEEPKLTNGGLYGAEIHATDCTCAQTKTARDSRRSPTRSGSPAFCTRFRKETARTHSVAMSLGFFSKRACFIYSPLAFHRQHRTRAESAPRVSSPYFGFIVSQYRTVPCITSTVARAHTYIYLYIHTQSVITHRVKTKSEHNISGRWNLRKCLWTGSR